MLGAGERDVAEALDAVGLAEHGADAAIEQQGFLVARPRRSCTERRERDVAEALDAVGLAEHVADAAIEQQRFLVARPGRAVLGAVERDVADALDAVGLRLGVIDGVASLTEGMDHVRGTKAAKPH